MKDETRHTRGPRVRAGTSASENATLRGTSLEADNEQLRHALAQALSDQRARHARDPLDTPGGFTRAALERVPKGQPYTLAGLVGTAMGLGMDPKNFPMPSEIPNSELRGYASGPPPFGRPQPRTA